MTSNLKSELDKVREIVEGTKPEKAGLVPVLRRLGFLGSIASLLGLVASVVFVIRPILSIKFSEKIGYTFTVGNVALIISVFLAIGAISYLLFQFAMAYYDLQERYNSLYGSFYSVLTENAPIYRALRGYNASMERIELISRYLVGVANQGTEINANDEKYWEFLKTTVDTTRSIFSRISDDDKCAVCIKIPNEENPRGISTLIRDSHSDADRSYVDRDDLLHRYDITSNTAFRTIVDKHHDDRAFTCNDLRGLAAQGLYQNANPKWSKYYNACVVVPIYASGGDVRDTLFGFVCVDNMKGGFEESIAVPILRIVANNIYIFMLKYLEVQAATPEVTKSTDVKKEKKDEST